MTRKVNILVGQILCLSIIGVALATSLTSLINQSIRLDEAQSIWVATKPLGTLLQLTGQDVQAPLYPVLLHFWMQILGTDIVTVRAISYIAYMLTLWIVYRFTSRLANRTTAVITLSLMAVSPFISWYGTEARTYTLLILFTCLSHATFTKLYTTRGKHGWQAYALVTLLGLYAHYFFAFIVICQILFVFGLFVKNFSFTKIPSNSLWSRLWLVPEFHYRYLLALVIIFIGFLPWLLVFFLYGGAANTQPLIAAPTSYNIVELYTSFIFGFQQTQIESLLVAVWPVSLLLLFVIFTQKHKSPTPLQSYFLLTTIVPVFLVFVLSYIKPIFLNRYLIITTPSLFLLLGTIISRYQYRIALAITNTLLFIMLVLDFIQFYSPLTPVRENFTGVAQYLNTHTTSRDIVVITPPFTIYPIEYSYIGAAALDTMPLWDRYQQGAIPPFSPVNFTKQLASYQKIYQKMYVVLSYDQGYQQTIINYLETNYQRLDKQTVSPRLEIRVYQLRYD